MIEFETCPVCGEHCHMIYRADGGWGVAVGCNHCYEPPKTRCPVCGELCRKIYRKARYFEIAGCEHCLIELDADEDADTHPGDYGLPDPEDEENNDE